MDQNGRMQNFLPFLNDSKRRRKDILSNTRRIYKDNIEMYNTTDSRNYMGTDKQQYVLQNKDQATSVSAHELKKNMHRSGNTASFGEQRHFMDSTSTNYSKFLDDLGPKRRYHEKVARTFKNESCVKNILKTDVTSNKHCMSLMSMREQQNTIDTTEIENSINNVDDMLEQAEISGISIDKNVKFKPNNALYRLNEVKWREKQESLKDSTTPSTPESSVK